MEVGNRGKMKETNEKVYRCDHCNKVMVSKGFMVLHERMCRMNPNNQHMCFLYCKYLEKDQEVISYGGDDGYPFNEKGNYSFCCTARPELGELYSYKLERFHENKARIKSMTRMPLQCDLYETMEGHDYSGDDDIRYPESNGIDVEDFFNLYDLKI